MDYRYFKGEKECPFDREKDWTRYVFWTGEQAHSAMYPEDVSAVEARFREVLRRGYAPLDDLVRRDLPLDERAVLFFIADRLSRFNPYQVGDVEWAAYFKAAPAS